MCEFKIVEDKDSRFYWQIIKNYWQFTGKISISYYFLLFFNIDLFDISGS